MPFNLDQILNGTRTVDVPFAGDTITVTYKLDTFRPEKTLKFGERVVALNGSLDAAYIERLADAVIDWDVLFKGKKVPLTVDGLNSVPWPIIKAVWTAVDKDANDSGKASASLPTS